LPRDLPLRRRSLTGRGRATVVMLLALGFAAGFAATRQLASLLARPREAALPPVAAGAPMPDGALASPTPLSAAAPLPAPPVPPLAPAAILATLPPTVRDGLGAAPGSDGAAGVVTERVEAPVGLEGVLGPLEIAYTLDPALTHRVAAILQRGRVALGHVVVLDVVDGRVLTYVSTDPQVFPATRPYPMASLMKVVTAAAVLRSVPDAASRPCVFRGSPYYLSAQLLHPPRHGRVASFERALATSNNQCFARLAVHAVGAPGLLDALATLGVIEPPAPGHATGEVDPVRTPLELGELGSGLAGSRLPPLAAARLAAALADGQLLAPRWIERVTDANGLDLALPQPAARRVLEPDVVRGLREMLVSTTANGTARRAFRGRDGKPLLAPIEVAGKTGSLSGRAPDGHYEWFIGVAPADAPQVAVATLVVNRGKWWKNASQVAAEVLQAVFCEEGRCRPETSLAADAGGGALAGPPALY
jgi:hypothetical protein